MNPANQSHIPAPAKGNKPSPRKTDSYETLNAFGVVLMAFGLYLMLR